MKKKWLFIGIIGLFVIGLLGNFDSENSDTNENQKVYSKPWRDPVNDEFIKIGRLMVSSGITGCGEYYVKENSIDEYIIACTRNGDDWQYYIASVNIDKIYSANEEFARKLTPPR